MDRSTILSTDNSLKDLIDSFIAKLSHHFEQLRLPRVQCNTTHLAHVYTEASVDNSAYKHEWKQQNKLHFTAKEKKTRKLSYRKDYRTMHPIYVCPENFRESLITPTATFPEIFNGRLLRLSL